MSRTSSSFLCALLATISAAPGCTGKGRTSADACPPQPPPEPRRVAAEAQDLRRMFAEATAARACDRLRGTFRPIGGEGEAPATGVVWIEECDARERDREVTLQLAGRGWAWVSRTAEKAGADFTVEQYVPYRFSLEVRGTVDVAYATGPKVLTAWFTPVGSPSATFQPIGEIDVETEGIWSSVVSGIASAFTTSPAARAEDKIAKVGANRFEQMFAQGIAVTVDLCTGRVRTGLGRPEAGEMLGAPPPVERAAAVLHRNGLLMRGPVDLPPGGTEIRVRGGGAVTARLVCSEHARAIARSHLEGSPAPGVPALASVEVRDRAVLKVPGPAACELVQVLEPLGLANGGDGIEVAYTVSELTADLAPLATCTEAAGRPGGGRAARDWEPARD